MPVAVRADGHRVVCVRVVPVVVPVRVFVVERLMLVLVCVRFGKVQHDAGQHQQAAEQHQGGERTVAESDRQRGADTSRLELTPQSPGLYALSLGLSHNFSDDHEMLKHGMVMYDALYAWCLACQAETHNWPPKMN